MLYPFDSLSQLVSVMTTEVGLIQAFAQDIAKGLSNRKPTLPSDFTDKEKADVDRVISAMKQQISPKKAVNKQVTLKVTSDSERVGAFFMEVAGLVKYRSFLPEMALSCLVSYLEAFVKDYVLAVLEAEPRMLKSGATITLEELSTHRSIKTIWKAAAE